MKGAGDRGRLEGPSSRRWWATTRRTATSTRCRSNLLDPDPVLQQGRVPEGGARPEQAAPDPGSRSRSTARSSSPPGPPSAASPPGWPSWVQIEKHATRSTTSRFASKHNGFDGLDTQLLINQEFGVKHLAQLAAWQKENIFSYGGRRGDAGSQVPQRGVRHLHAVVRADRRLHEGRELQVGDGPASALWRSLQAGHLDHRRAPPSG